MPPDLKRPSTCLTATLHHLGLTTPSPDDLAAFYARALGYRFESAGDQWVGRGPGRALLLSPGPAKGLGSIGFAVTDALELERLAARIEAAGHAWRGVASPLLAEALEVRDPDGNRLHFGLPYDQDSAAGGAGPFPLEARIQHTVIASRDPERMIDFFQGALGFTLSDLVLDDGQVLRTAFLRCSHEHHSFAVFRAAEDRLDHHCYETRDWNAIRDWGDHMAAQRIPIKWGPGRHGPGNNLFLFVHDPDGNWVELSAELEIVPHHRPAGVWPHEERTLNSWGQALLRS